MVFQYLWYSHANNIDRNILLLSLLYCLNTSLLKSFTNKQCDVLLAMIYNKFTWCLAVLTVVIRNGKIISSSYPLTLKIMLFWSSNLRISFMSMGYLIPNIFNSRSYSWYFETLNWWFLRCTGCNDDRINHKKHFSSLFWILRHLCFPLSSLGNGT